MNFLFDRTTKRIISSLYGAAELQFADFSLGEVVPCNVAIVDQLSNPINTRLWQPYQFQTGDIVKLGLGNPFLLPIAGSFTLTYNGDTTVPISYSASSTDIQTALNNLGTVISDGTVSVSGSNGYFFITFNATGIRFTFTGSAANLAPPSIIDIGILVEGTSAGASSLHSVQSVRIYQNPAAYSSFNSLTAGPNVNVTRVQIGGGGNNDKTRFYLYPTPYDGSWTITVGGQETVLLAWNCLASDIQTAVGALSTVGGVANVQVVQEQANQFLVAFQAGKANTNMGTITANGNSLQVIQYLSGTLDLREAAIQILLGNSSSAAVIFEAEFTPNGGSPVKVARVNKNLVSEVIPNNSSAIPPGKQYDSFNVVASTGVESERINFPAPFGGTPTFVQVSLSVPSSGSSGITCWVDQTSIDPVGFTIHYGATMPAGYTVNVLAFL